MSNLTKFAVLSTAIGGALTAFAGAITPASAEDFRCDRTVSSADNNWGVVGRAVADRVVGFCDRNRDLVHFYVIRKSPLVPPDRDGGRGREH